MPPLQALIGLGNPGQRYRDTRHNAGEWFVHLLLQRHGTTLKSSRRVLGDYALLHIDGMPLHCLLPHAYVNESGASVTALCHYYKLSPDSLLVAQDELDLPTGTVRLKRGGGHGGHNGLRDIQQALGGCSDFSRVRIGIGHPGERHLVTPHVLSRPDTETAAVLEAAMNKALDTIPALLSGNWDAATTALHSSTDKTAKDDQCRAEPSATAEPSQ